MLAKKPGCITCPLYDDGQGFCEDQIIPGAKVLVLLQNPGEQEERQGTPAIGKTGELLDNQLLPAAGLTRGKDVSVCNAIRCRWRNPVTGKKANDLPSGATLASALWHCRQFDVRGTAEVVLAAGALAWKATGQTGSITEWRGYQGSTKFLGLPVVGTVHSADLFHNPRLLLAVQNDFRKATKVLAGEFPKPFPPFTAEATPSQFRSFVEKCVEQSVEYVVADTEFHRETKRLTMLGLGAPFADGFSGVQADFAKTDAASFAEIGDWYRALVQQVPIVFQNCLADIPVLEKAFGVRYSHYKRIDDTMLAHAPLWSEWEHKLEFLASIYSSHNKTKHLASTNFSLYNQGDVWDTAAVWEGVRRELEADLATKAIYEIQSLALVPILLKSKGTGIRVDKRRVRPLLADYRGRVDEAAKVARAALGWPINIGSPPQLANYFYNVAKFPKLAGRQGKKGGVDKDVLAGWRDHLGFESQYDDDGTISRIVENIEAGSDPVLEARVAYAAIQQSLSHYLEPLASGGVIIDRIYPDIKIHAQASGRWSITDPPLAQLPEDLRDLICPDIGEAWISWDWHAIELRILAKLTNDSFYLDALDKDWEVHALNFCDMFGYPYPVDRVHPENDADWVKLVKWRGGSDPRRKFVKSAVYRLHYRGDPKKAHQIPGAKHLNVNRKVLVEACEKYLAKHPGIVAFWDELDKQAFATGKVRTWAGRRRALLGGAWQTNQETGKLYRDITAPLREASNHPLQGGVADILNLTTIAVAKRLPYATLVYTAHDAALWSVPVEKREEAYEVIQEEATRSWPIAGGLVIPAKMKSVVVGEAF